MLLDVRWDFNHDALFADNADELLNIMNMQVHDKINMHYGSEDRFLCEAYLAYVLSISFVPESSLF